MILEAMPALTLPPPRKRSRPRGLWKGRVTATPRFLSNDLNVQVHDSPKSFDSSDSDSDSDEDDFLPISKRLRHGPDFEEPYFWDRGPSPSPTPLRSPDPFEMDTSTTGLRGARFGHKPTCNYEDWEDLKTLFNTAAEQYESNDASESLPTLRAVVHQCHRILTFYHDPSDLFTNPPHPGNSSPDALTPTMERFTRDWGFEPSSTRQSHGRVRKNAELPTAFHAIFGTALFLFGNLIAQDSSLALAGEPNNPCPYWLAALDVFETGENLPSRIDGRGGDVTEDWRMAIVWGRTLVCIAEEITTRNRKAKESADGGVNSISPLAQFSADEPNWPVESPFAAIAARRPPVTQRMSLLSASANDLMILAMDQFSRGIFHMPHPGHHPASAEEPFSRAKELYTIASEVLFLAERLEIASERQYWASWADSVFNQMKMEGDMDAWREPIMRSRGRCCLIVGTSLAEELEDALENEAMDVLHSEEAQEAREALNTAISFFERARSYTSSPSDPDFPELQPLLAEALLTLANLTIDEDKREELYARAQLESGNKLNLDRLEDVMDES